MTVKTIAYFEKVGSKNTDETLRFAHERALELGIRDVVVASSHGETALKAAKIFGSEKFNIVAVTICEGYRSEGWTMTVDERKRLLDKGVKVFTGIHAFGGEVGSAFSEKRGGTTINEAVCETLYRFCQGMKVAVEVALAAVELRKVKPQVKIIAVGGTGEGADTAIVVRTAVRNEAFGRDYEKRLSVQEILAMPIEKL